MIFLRINIPNFVQAYRYDSSREVSDGVTFTRPGKCRYRVPSHTVPLQALTAAELVAERSRRTASCYLLAVARKPVRAMQSLTTIGVI